jgi:arginine-tRNA-protein transferase
MMFAQVHFPESLAPHELDAYLERGWFRMGQTIFTTNFLHFKDRMYSAVWLRIKLWEFTSEKTQVKLNKKNAHFKTIVREANVTLEHERLYAKYKEEVDFEPSVSLTHLLYGKSPGSTIYQTFEIAVYDEHKLIASGFFDIGEVSAEGIVSVYDPDYKKYSLGKFLIYKKIEFCRDRGLQYFYPGYFVPGYAFFDYKLAIGTSALEFLQLRTQRWLPYQNFCTDDIPYEVMRGKLDSLHAALQVDHIDANVMHYEFFDANLIPDLKDVELFNYPVMLYGPGKPDDEIQPITVYDVVEQKFYIFKCFAGWTTNVRHVNSDFYSSHVLIVEYEIFSSSSIEETANALKKLGPS